MLVNSLWMLCCIKILSLPWIREKTQQVLYDEFYNVFCCHPSLLEWVTSWYCETKWARADQLTTVRKSVLTTNTTSGGHLSGWRGEEECSGTVSMDIMLKLFFSLPPFSPNVSPLLITNNLNSILLSMYIEFNYLIQNSLWSIFNLVAVELLVWNFTRTPLRDLRRQWLLTDKDWHRTQTTNWKNSSKVLKTFSYFTNWLV